MDSDDIIAYMAYLFIVSILCYIVLIPNPVVK